METETQFAVAEEEGARWTAASSHNPGGIRARTGAGANDENAPLLSSVAEGSSGSGEDSWDPYVSGGREFEGKPWWKKPSVRLTLRYSPVLSLIVIKIRCFGFYHPFYRLP